MAVFTGTATSTANGDSQAVDALMDEIATAAATAGWTILARRPNVPGEEAFGSVGRPTYGAPHRYWRVYLRGTTRVRIAEINFLDTTGAPISNSGVYPEANDTEYGSSPGEAIDGNSATYWRGDNGNSEWWFSIDYGDRGANPTRVESVGGVSITTSSSEHIEAVRIEFSDDGNDWFSAYDSRLAADGGDPEWHFDGLTWTSGETKILMLDYAGTANESRPLRRFGEVLYLRGPGGGAGRESYVILSSERDLGAAIQGLRVRYATGFDPGMSAAYQPGGLVTDYFVPLDRDLVEFWLYINDRRILAQTRSGSVYGGFYAGFFVPYCLPSEYDFPAVAIGNRTVLGSVNDGDAGHRNIFDPGPTGSYRRWDGQHVAIANHREGGGVNYPITSLSVRIWPWAVGGAGSGAFTGANWEGPSGGNSSGHWTQYVDRTAQGDLPLLPAMLLDQTGPGSIGALDGVFWIPGADLTPGQLISVGARTFRAFPNCNRRAAEHWCAIEEI